jgi:demethylmenaquinone methyltransferase/2-methoxy-6-polyprenyl-1,4-benzoquinol methylase
MPSVYGDKGLQMNRDVKGKYVPVTRITKGEHITVVKDIFRTITKRYDFLNHFYSLGQDMYWRKFTVRKMRFFNMFSFLDVATGTGDLAIKTALRYPSVRVVGIDFVQEMMDRGRKKIENQKLFDRVAFSRGDALHLPFPDNHFDVAGIAFGIRNITERVKALEEMRRVVVPGGQVMVLEMNFPRQKKLQHIYHLYLNHVLPLTSRYFSRNPAAYYYLADSIVNFPSPEEFALLMKKAGLEDIATYPLTMGITHLYVGIKG